MFFIVLNVVIFLNVHSTKKDKSTKIGTQCVFLQMLWMMQYALEWHIEEKYIFSKDRLSKIFYWMIVNNGIPLKVTYTIKFMPPRPNLKSLIFSFYEWCNIP